MVHKRSGVARLVFRGLLNHGLLTADYGPLTDKLKHIGHRSLLTKALSILTRGDESFDHLGLDEVAVELVEFG